MASPAGFEPTTSRLGGARSILLSYGDVPRLIAAAAPRCTRFETATIIAQNLSIVPTGPDPEEGAPAAELTRRVTRGVRRWLAAQGLASVTEFTLPSGRRLDVLAVDRRGIFTAVEVKVSVADLRGDRKWESYRDWCDRLFFAVPHGFPTILVPQESGLLVADGFDAAEHRPAPGHPLAPARRRSMLIEFGLLAAGRLHGLEDGFGRGL